MTTIEPRCGRPGLYSAAARCAGAASLGSVDLAQRVPARVVQ